MADTSITTVKPSDERIGRQDIVDRLDNVDWEEENLQDNRRSNEELENPLPTITEEIKDKKYNETLTQLTIARTKLESLEPKLKKTVAILNEKDTALEKSKEQQDHLTTENQKLKKSNEKLRMMNKEAIRRLASDDYHTSQTTKTKKILLTANVKGRGLEQSRIQNSNYLNRGRNQHDTYIERERGKEGRIHNHRSRSPIHQTNTWQDKEAHISGTNWRDSSFTP